MLERGVPGGFRDMDDHAANADRADRDALLDEALDIFQPRTQRRLTREDAREIYVNLTGFFRVLQDWDRAERERQARDAGSEASAAASSQP